MPVRDFPAILRMAMSPNLLVAHPLLPVKSVKELIALAKARPGRLDYASSSIGSSTHLAGELFRFMAGVNTVLVSHKAATASTIAALISGEVQFTIYGSYKVPDIKSGKLTGLAVASARPSALFLHLHSAAPSGLLGYETVSIYGVLARLKRRRRSVY